MREEKFYDGVERENILIATCLFFGYKEGWVFRE